MNDIKKITEILLSYMNKDGMADKEELIRLIKPYVNVIPAETLMHRHIGGVINQVLAKVIDERGAREILAMRQGKDTEYISLSKCKDREILKAMLERIQRDIDGRMYTKAKIMKVLDGQLAMDFMAKKEAALPLAQESGRVQSK